MTVICINNGCDVREMGEGVTGHWPCADTLGTHWSHHWYQTRHSRWNNIPQIPQWVSGPQTSTQMSEAEAWPSVRVDQHHISRLEFPRSRRPSKIGGQSTWGLRAWGEGTFPAVLMSWTGSTTTDSACQKEGCTELWVFQLPGVMKFLQAFPTASTKRGTLLSGMTEISLFSVSTWLLWPEIYGWSWKNSEC